jgi:hypothetical protein
MPQHQTKLIVAGDRKSIRKAVIGKFLEEEPGLGRGELCSVYRYFVEEIADGRRIFLKRPARLNKGVDFEVNVENTNFGVDRRTTMPSHNAICDDLLHKKQENLEEYKRVKTLIDRLYACEEVLDNEMRELHFGSGHPIELILKSIKWLFIEQDVTYWNWSGRNMLYTGIQNV